MAYYNNEPAKNASYGYPVNYDINYQAQMGQPVNPYQNPQQYPYNPNNQPQINQINHNQMNNPQVLSPQVIVIGLKLFKKIIKDNKLYRNWIWKKSTNNQKS